MKLERLNGVVVTGGSGFIGSHLVDILVSLNLDGITVIDNLSAGRFSNISKLVESRAIKFCNQDLCDINKSVDALADSEAVFHFAAYPEVRTYNDPLRYFQDNIKATFELLESFRNSSAKYFLFSSSSTVYGVPAIIPTPEHYGPLIPISHYGASKLACESLISAYSKTYGFDSYIFRFANVVGSRSNHGILWDFIRKIRKDPRELQILGDGSQTKSYIHVADCINAMIHAFEHVKERVNILNIGTKDGINVITIADIVSEYMNARNVKYNFVNSTPNGAGWIGDVKNMNLDVSKLDELGYSTKYTCKDAIKMAVRELII